MPRLQFNPSLLECPDFSSPIYAAVRGPLVNADTTEEQAVQLLKDVWTAGNVADRGIWQTQVDEDEALRVEQLRVRTEADELRIQKDIEEAEALRRDDIKKNKSKHVPIPDRDVPTVAPVFASNYAVRKMEKGLYVELWYYTNAGLEEALRNSNTTDDEAMVMLRLPNGFTSWVPAASTRTATAVTDDRNIRWEDFCQAAPRMILTMEEADWPQERVAMLAKFWGNLQIHEFRSSTDPLDQKALLVYQAEQRRLWHLAISSPQGAYNLSRINEEILRKTREKVYWDERHAKDYERDYRVSFFLCFFYRKIYQLTFSSVYVLSLSRLFMTLRLCSTHASPTLLLACPHLLCSMHALPPLLHACFTLLCSCMPLCAIGMLHPGAPAPHMLYLPHRCAQSDQRILGASSSQRRVPSLSQRDYRRRSVSPERPSSQQRPPPYEKASAPGRRPDFQASTGGRVYSACAVCLGRHPHKIVECAATMLWDNSLPSLALRSNKVLTMRDGRSVCADWQRVSGCPSARHDTRHICSGCASSSHGAQDCARAQKTVSSNSI